MGERRGQSGVLLLAEVLPSHAEDGLGAVERITLAASVAQGGLLNPAPYFVNGGGAELDHMEHVQHRDGVFELIVDGVLVTGERVQRCHLHPAAGCVTALLEPARVRLPPTCRASDLAAWRALGRDRRG